MKVKPQIYAQTLIESAKSDNLKVLARKFWKVLQKNKQYRDLGQVIDALDVEQARIDNKILTKVYSKNALTEPESQTITEKLEKKFKKAIILKNIVGKNITGVIVEVEGKVMDLSVEDKINRLKKVISY